MYSGDFKDSKFGSTFLKLLPFISLNSSQEFLCYTNHSSCLKRVCTQTVPRSLLLCNNFFASDGCKPYLDCGSWSNNFLLNICCLWSKIRLCAINDIICLLYWIFGPRCLKQKLTWVCLWQFVSRGMLDLKWQRHSTYHRDWICLKLWLR